MKKTIIALSLVCASLFAVKYREPVRKSLPHLAVIGMVAGLKQKGKWDSLTDSEKAFAEAQDEAAKGLITLETLDAKLKELGVSAETKGLTTEQMAEFKDLLTGYKAISEKLQKLEDAGAKSATPGAVIANGLKDNAEKIKSFREKKTRGLEFEIKASQEPTDIATHTIGYRVPGIGQLPVRKPFLMDLFRVVPVNLEYIKYMDQETAVRDAKNVAGTATSTHNTKLTWKERSIQITKIRDFVDISVDMLEDYDFVQSEITNLLSSSVILKADNGLLTGTGTNPELHSIDEVASEFDATNTLSGTITPWAATVSNPDIFALAIAMASQIIALGKDNNYMPDTILINTIDKYKSMLIKDNEGRYLMPPFVAVVNNKEYTIDSMVVRSNPNVPANSMYVFDSSKGTIYMRRGISLQMSYENSTNFEHEVVTMKAYLRMNLLIRNVDANAFMKTDDLAAAIASLGGA